ncbi:MAG: hypothetical protein MUF79_01795 [Burkholderiales bacterium]|jgi:hypothetical protein|nr:hypothetical protein [Burkholderiales bacterium]
MMDLDDLLVLEDREIGDEGESLLETAFPESFYVVGADGGYLTTPNNYEVFQRAIDLLDEGMTPDDPDFRSELESLLEDADELSQEDYDEAYEKSLLDEDEDLDDEKEERWRADDEE